jgi:predicted metal-dependent enzyme (double-stranded beta helix superfamily)
MTTADSGRLRSFITGIATLLQEARDEQHILDGGGALLQRLVACDDWLPEAYALADPERYGQYLLHCDSLERFSVVSFVWGPGQATPIHDHTVWGLVGVLRGAELCQAYARQAGRLVPSGAPRRLEPGEVQAVSPRIGDIHQVANAFDDRVSISIHAYGGNIGAVRRSTYDLEGRAKPFVSGYSNTTMPNFWGGG